MSLFPNYQWNDKFTNQQGQKLVKDPFKSKQDSYDFFTKSISFSKLHLRFTDNKLCSQIETQRCGW